MSTRMHPPSKEAQQLVVRGDRERSGMAEAGIAQPVHHRREDVLESQKLKRKTGRKAKQV